MRLRWKKHEKETGLRAVIAGPRGSDYTDGVTKYASVYAHSTRHTGKVGWYWVCSHFGSYVNTCSVTDVTEQDAKDGAAAYVKAQLAKPTASA